MVGSGTFREPRPQDIGPDRAQRRSVAAKDVQRDLSSKSEGQSNCEQVSNNFDSRQHKENCQDAHMLGCGTLQACAGYDAPHL